MQLSDLRQSLQDEGYGTDTAQVQTRMLNAAYREIHSRMRWPFLEAIDSGLVTVAGTSAYTPSNTMSTWRNIDAVRLSQPAKLNFVNIEYMQPQELFDMANVNPTETATPRYWTMYASQFHFFPTPDDAYTATVYYITEPPDMSADTDVPVIPVAYHDAIVSGAICRIAFRERDWIGLELWTAKYEKDVQRLEEEYLVRQRQSSSEVKRSGYWNTQINYPLTATGF